MKEMLQVAAVAEGLGLALFLAGLGIYAICPRLPVSLMIPGVCVSGFFEICGICIAIMGIASVMAGSLYKIRGV
jgi:hypothetical protein